MKHCWESVLCQSHLSVPQLVAPNKPPTFGPYAETIGDHLTAFKYLNAKNVIGSMN
jgi:hypothetical protein